MVAMPFQCNYIFGPGNPSGLCIDCGKPMEPCHRIYDGYEARLVCSGCCPQHRTVEPFADDREAVTVAGEQVGLF